MSSSTPEESIFYAALQVSDADARSDYISRACGIDGELRQRVERLVSAYGDGEFLESPIADVAATALLTPIGEKPGDVIGPYKLLEQIGEGGMGLVFMAEQAQPLRRRVALKIIKPGLDTRAVIARFEAERQALALMDHPNIARVYDAGATESGRPYFVMELVRGQPITEFCVAGKLNLRDRLELFNSVCEAIQHAHQKGIIHRDLKPSNILVTQTDTDPVPKVIDFGVAKATSQQLTDRTLFTAFTQIIGTPLYMSPEQADVTNQDIDTRSDIYSLGVVLYEMLTGTTPFDGEQLRTAGVEEMRRIIREVDPPKPSTRATTMVSRVCTGKTAPKIPRPDFAPHLLKGELDWIVMKSLDKDRRRRYESASAMSADLKRFLRQEPVEACPPSSTYRLRKYATRNKTMIATAAVVLTSLVLGTVVSTWQAIRATRATREAQATAARETKLREVADAGLAIVEVQSLISHRRFEEAEKRLSEIPAELAVHDWTHLQLHRQMGVWHALHERWDKAAASLLRAMQLNHIDTESHIMNDYIFYGAVLLMLGDTAGYEQFQTQAVSRFSTTKYPVDAARVCKMALLRPASEKVMSDLDALYDAAMQGQSMPKRQSLKDWASFSLAMVDYRRGNYERAIALSQPCLNATMTGCAAGAYAIQAMAHHQLHQDAEARDALAKAYDAHQTRATGVYPDFYDNSTNLVFFDGLDTHLVLREADALITGRPLNNENGYAAAQKALGDQYFTGNRYHGQNQAEAAKWYRKAAEQGLTLAELALARMYFTGSGVGKDPAEAVKWLHKTAEREDGEQLNDLAWSLVTNANSKRGDPQSAIVLAEKAVEKTGKGNEWNTLGVAYYRAGNWNAAIAALEKSMELGDGGDGNDWFFLAMAHWQLGHQEEARKWFDQAAEWMKNRPADATLNRFRAEATQLIGVAHSASSTIPPREANESQNANIPESTVSSAPDK